MGSNHENAPFRNFDRFSRLRRPALFVGLMLLVLLGLFWFSRDQLRRNPVYNGKALSLWLETYDPESPFGSGSPEWLKTDEAVRHIGTNALPILLQMLCDTDSDLKIRLAALAGRQHLMKIHFVPARTWNIEASRAFIVLGDTAKDAVPDLIKAFNENHSVESQCAIENALKWMGPAARPALPLFLQTASNPNNTVRANALWALGEIHAEPQVCVPVLIQGLNDLSDDVRASAAHALGKFGADAESAIPNLMELTNRPFVSGQFSFTYMEAVGAIRKIAPAGSGDESFSADKVFTFDSTVPPQ
jgi:HEAT repeats